MTIARDHVVGDDRPAVPVGAGPDLAGALPAVGGSVTRVGLRRHRPPLGPIALRDVVKRHSSFTAAWQSPDGLPLQERSYELVELADEVEVWLIHWPAGGHLQLHDHGGSAGAFWVVSGSLEERYVSPGCREGSLRQRRHAAGTGTAFGGEYVHDVRNGGRVPATSVHAYSPPMPAMTYFRTTAAGLVADRTEYRSDPSWAP